MLFLCYVRHGIVHKLVSRLGFSIFSTQRSSSTDLPFDLLLFIHVQTSQIMVLSERELLGLSYAVT